MSRKADCWDNAVVESFFATLKQELIDKKSWPTHASAPRGIGEYIDQFYNDSRRHSALGYRSPLDFELADGQHKVAS
jgi:transposase InsO family protein